MDIPGVLGIVVLLGFVVETLVEAALGEPFNHFPKIAPFKWLLKYAAYGVGIAGALIYKFDFMVLAGAYFKEPQPLTAYGMILTGIAIGGGSQLLHAIIGWFKKPQMPAIIANLAQR